MHLLRPPQSSCSHHKDFRAAFNLQQCLTERRNRQSPPPPFKNPQPHLQNSTAALPSHSHPTHTPSQSHHHTTTNTKMCILLARTCPSCFTPHSITRLKTCQEYKHTSNCPSRQLKQVLMVPHVELCDRCWGQDGAVLEVEGAVARAMVRGEGR